VRQIQGATLVAAAALAECVRHLQPLRQAARIRLLSVEVALLVQVRPDRQEVLALLIPHQARAAVVVDLHLLLAIQADLVVELELNGPQEVQVRQAKETRAVFQLLASMLAAAEEERAR
jgi:hypothetical protein